ncbi:beta-lactamase-like protein [Linnemannia elongata]|nr:beta-lactamase-like protein [Linnemannia elongata]
MATKETPKFLPDQNEFLELRPGLYRCTFVLTFGPVGLPIATFLIRGNPIPATDNKAHEWIMIDAGAPPHAAQILAAVERVLSHPQDTLKYLCITHSHMDHTGTTLLLLERYPTCKVIAHPEERPFLCEGKGYNSCSGDRWVFNVMKFLTGAPAKMKVPVENVVWVREGEEWEYQSVLKVVETPGHTPGSISFIHTSSRSFMIGDACKNHMSFSKLPNLSYPPSRGTCYMDTAIRSMDKIISLKDQVDTIFPAHDYNPEGLTVQELETYRAATPSP